MAGGRPTEYKEEYCQKVDEYLKTCVDEIEEFHKTRGDKSDTFDRIIKVNLPTVEGLAQYLDVSRRVIFKWADEHEEFMHSLEKLNEAQKSALLAKGLSGEYNPTIAKLILSSNHDMKDKSETTVDKESLAGLTSFFKEASKPHDETGS